MMKWLFVVLLGFTCSPPSWAGTRFPSWAKVCAEFLRSIGKKTAPVSQIQADPRVAANESALQKGLANFVSQELGYITIYRPDEFTNWAWIDNLTVQGVERILDKNLPNWREDRDWYFQTTLEIELYPLHSDKKVLFAPGDYILMNDAFAVGRINLGGRRHLDLFE